MQSPTLPRSNRDRTDTTCAALMASARKLFVAKGYAATATPEIVAAAKVTRGALYHHFDGKEDLFLAVARQAAEEVSREISRRTRGERSPLEALVEGAEAYFAAMAGRGRARLLLLEAPAILNPDQLLELSDLAGARELRQGLANLLSPREQDAAPLDELTQLLSAAFDRAALAIAKGESAAPYKQALRFLLARIASRA